MWKQFFDMARQMLLMTESTTKNRADLTALQKEFKDFTEKTEASFHEQKQFNERLYFEIKRLADKLEFELQRLNDKQDGAQEREARERENLLLKIENQLLKATRQLPPQPDDKDDNK